MISPTIGNRLIITLLFTQVLISDIEGRINICRLFAKSQMAIKNTTLLI